MYKLSVTEVFAQPEEDVLYNNNLAYI